MKKILWSLVFVLFFNICAYAETYLIYENSTKEILSLSPEDDAQLSDGHTKEILDIDFRDIRLQYHPVYYKWLDGKFIVNIQKLSDEVIVQQEAEEIHKEEEWIEIYLKDLSITELRKIGKTFKHLKKSDE